MCDTDSLNFRPCQAKGDISGLQKLLLTPAMSLSEQPVALEKAWQCCMRSLVALLVFLSLI
jgi:hypothetical protein